MFYLSKIRRISNMDLFTKIQVQNPVSVVVLEKYSVLEYLFAGTHTRWIILGYWWARTRHLVIAFSDAEILVVVLDLKYLGLAQLRVLM